MSGLIWAGLGKGISDAGTSIGNAMMRKMEREELEAREARADQRLEDRERRAEERKEAALKRDADIYAAAEEAAPGIGEDRRFAKFQADLGETSLSPEDQRKIFDEQYNQRRVGDFEGADRYLERYSKLKEDVLGEIRRRGGSSGLISSAASEYKATLEAERAADRAAFDERKFEASEDRRSREFMAMLPIRQQTADATTARATGGSGSGAPRESDINAALNAWTTSEQRARASFRKPTTMEEMDPAAMQRYQDALNKHVSNDAAVKAARQRYESLAGGQSTVGGNKNRGDNSQGGLPKPTTRAELSALPKGTRYQAPDGTIRIKQ